jgi:hypothetical protein
MSQESFIEAEKRERRLLTKLDAKLNELHLIAISDISSFKPYDAIGAINGQLGYIEVKIRECAPDTHQTVWIEKEKVDRIIAEMKTIEGLRNVKIYLISAYTKTKEVLLFSLLDTPHIIMLDQYCPDTTMADNGSKNKDMLAYKIEDAIMRIKL